MDKRVLECCVQSCCGDSVYLMSKPGDKDKLFLSYTYSILNKSENTTYRILGECLLISSLPGKALRTHVDIARLAERFNMRSQSRAW